MFCIRIEDVEWGSTRYVESENFKYKHIRNKHLQISNMSPSQSWDKPCALFWYSYTFSLEKIFLNLEYSHSFKYSPLWKIHCCDLTIIRRNRFCIRYFAPRKSLKRNQLKVLVLTVIEFDNLGWHDVIIQSPFHTMIFFYRASWG